MNAKLGQCFTRLEPHEKRLLRIRTPERKLSISRFFDKKFSLKRLQEDGSDGPVESPPAQAQTLLPKVSHELLEAPIDSKLLSSSMRESGGDREGADEEASEGPRQNDFIKQKMYCRLMHTKRGNLWNELHKLDRKRIKLLMNKFVIQKDHEAMQYIIRNQQKELVERHCQRKQRMAKVEHIKQSKAARKAETLVRLRQVEKRNFDSVLRYLSDTVSAPQLERMIAQTRRRPKASVPTKRPPRRRPEQPRRRAIEIGKKKLFGKLAKINSDLYREVYRETQKRFRRSGSRGALLRGGRGKAERGAGSASMQRNKVDFGQDFHQLYIRESMKVGAD